MNEYDSNKMSDVLKASHNLDLTEDINEADVLLINTCSIREKAEDKLISSTGSLEKAQRKESKSSNWCRWLCCLSGGRPHS